MRNKSLFFLLLPIFISCDPVRFKTTDSQVEGYVPVYVPSLASAKQITAEAARPTVNGGKIYTIGKLLFQVEQDSGIHVINYGDPNDPRKLGFIRSFLCKELSVKNGFIYTNNVSDLVVIDFSDPNNIHEVNRVKDVFPDLALQYPPKTSDNTTIYFECPDPSRGNIVSWEKQTIKNPKCWR